MNITFLVYKLELSRLETTEFYRQDLEILRSLGHNVTVATRLREVRQEADCVFLWWWNWLWLIGPVLKAKGLPICVTGSLEPDIYEKRSWLFRRLVKFGMQFADRSVFVSQYMIDRLKELMPLRDPLLCPHIVLDEYRPIDSNNTRALPYTIANVAWKTRNNIHRKMIPELIDAFAIVKKSIPEARLALAGEMMDGGPLLLSQAEKLGLTSSIDFLGKICREDKIRLMQDCGAYYQCSRHEGFGVAIAEAMACGAPVVVNRKTAIPEVVGDCGRYVTDESAEAIATSLTQTLRQREASRELGLQAASRIDRHFRFARRRDFFGKLLSEMMQERSTAKKPFRTAA